MAATARPRLRLERTALDVAIEALGVAALVVQVAATAAYWPELPDRVPTHFGAGGLPDDWGPRWTLLLLPALAVGLYAMLAVLSRYPHIYNYPVRVTEENAARQYGLARGLLLWMRAEIAWLFAGLQWGTIRVALGRVEGFGVWFMLFWLGVIFGTVAVYIVRAMRAR